MDADNAASYRRLKVSTRCLSASPDGKLPIDFDPLVREAFGEGLAVAS